MLSTKVTSSLVMTFWRDAAFWAIFSSFWALLVGVVGGVNRAEGEREREVGTGNVLPTGLLLFRKLECSLSML